MTASVWLAMPNLERMLLTCDLMVEGLTVSFPAIWVLFSPLIMRVFQNSRNFWLMMAWHHFKVWIDRECADLRCG